MFSPNQIVECIDAGAFETLDTGKLYRIETVWPQLETGQSLILKSINPIKYCASRFRLVEPASADFMKEILNHE